MEKSKSEKQISINQLPIYKLVLIGDSNVGKTTIISMYKNKDFTSATEATISTQFFTKIVDIPSNFDPS
jgi:GTPase SAR1 family protein